MCVVLTRVVGNRGRGGGCAQIGRFCRFVVESCLFFFFNDVVDSTILVVYFIRS
jgi:hypothetical protein